MRWIVLLLVLTGCHASQVREVKFTVAGEPGSPVKLETSVAVQF